MNAKIHTILVTLVGLMTLSGCAATIKDIKTDNTSKVSEDLVLSSKEDLNASESIIRIPISKKIPFFEIGDANVYKTNSNIAISFNRTPFRTAMKAIAKEINANIIFNYENKEIKTADSKNNNQHVLTPTSKISGKNGGADDDYAYQLGKDSVTSTKNTPIDSRKRVEYFDRSISLEYKGSVKELFNYLSETTNYFFILQGNNLIIKSSNTFKIMIPNYPGIMLEIGKSIEKLGASDIAYDEVSSNISFTADYPTYKRIYDFTTDIKNNMALV
ncbi:MAG: hypothetical protein WCI04_07630, partial [archaeon]